MSLDRTNGGMEKRLRAFWIFGAVDRQALIVSHGGPQARWANSDARVWLGGKEQEECETEAGRLLSVSASSLIKFRQGMRRHRFKRGWKVAGEGHRHF